MQTFSKMLLLTFLVFGITGTTMAANNPNLGLAASYGLIGGTYLNDSLSNTINGDIGFTTAPAAIPGPLGFHPSVTYPNYGDTANDTPQARLDMANALFIDLAPQPCVGPNIPGTNLSTDIIHGPIGVYEPGVYCTDGAVTAANITLSGAGTYIFRINGALDTTAGDQVILTNGAGACDVFWTPIAATTFGANTDFIGTVIDNANAINIGSNVNWTGRALSLGAGSVGTLGSINYIVTPPVCTARLNVIKTVTGSTAPASGFVIELHTSTGVVVGSGVGTGTPGTLYFGLSVGIYLLFEDSYYGYVPSFTGDCDSTGNVSLIAGDNKTCTLFNIYNLFTLHIAKHVVGGPAVAADFTLLISNASGVIVGSGLGTEILASYTVVSGQTYTLSESGSYTSSYTPSFSADCLGGIIVANTDGMDCTITNTYITPPSGGGGGSPQDSCPDGDYSPSYYDGICGIAPITGAITHISTGASPFIIPGLPITGIYTDKQNISWNIIIFGGTFIILLTSYIIISKKRKI